MTTEQVRDRSKFIGASDVADFHIKLKDDKGVYYDATIHMNITLDEQMALKNNNVETINTKAKKYQWIICQYDIRTLRKMYQMTPATEKFATKEEVENHYDLTDVKVIEPYLPSGE